MKMNQSKEIIDRFREWIYIVCLTSFIAITYAFGRYIFSMVTPDIVRSLNISYEFVGRINAMHQFAYLTFSLLGGFLCGKIGVQRTISISVLLCGLSVLALTFVGNGWVLLCIVTLQGIFAATSWIPMVEFVTEHISEQNRGKSMGVIASGTSFGVIINGALIPFILSKSTWHTVWFVFGLISLIIGALGVFFVNQLGKSSGIQKVNKEKNTFDDSLMSVSYLQYGLLIFLLILSGLYLIPFQSYITAYIQEDLQLTENIAGICWGIFGVIGIFSGLFGGFIADKMSAKRALNITYAGASLCLGLIAFVPTITGVILSCVFFGLVYNAIFGLHPTYVSKIVPIDRTAKLFGILNVALGFGSMGGNYFVGASKEIFGSFIFAYQIMFVLSLVALLITVFLKQDKKRMQKKGKENG